MKTKTKRKTNKLTIFLFILDILACICLFLAYGPISYFRTMLVTTAMETATHHYLARTLYSDAIIAKVLNSNYIAENDNSTDTSLIKFDNQDDGNYESIYEEQILKRDEGNDLYKIIEINENGYAGYLAVIYDPSKLSLVMAKNPMRGGQTLTQITETYNAVLATNAGGHYYPYGISNYSINPAGSIIKDGELYFAGVRPSGWGGGFIGFTFDNVLLLSKGTADEVIASGMRDAMEFGPFLIVNGEPSRVVGNGGYGLAPRTAIGQRKDGIVLLLVIDGRSVGHSLGIDMNSMIDIFIRYGAYNAANLDGGGSSAMAVNHVIINQPQMYGYASNRYLYNAWALIDSEE
ncbi:MAG: phosphodiester glycosidase family protein [Bacilli bacterium]|nr:phosphodiester glycosidase family protein [Bacilli bacterium]